MRPLLLLAALAALGAASASSAAAVPSFDQAVVMPARELIPSLKRAVLKDSPAGAFSDRDEETLIALLSDQDARVRAQAARALKPYATPGGRAEEALLKALGDTWQPEAVRREAAKSLARAALGPRSRDELLELALDEGRPASLREIACKALWLSAGQDAKTQDALRELLADGSQPEAARAGAAWALFADTGDPRTRDALRERAADGGLSTPLPVRYEAVRSLYLAMGEGPVADAVRAVAMDGWAPAPLRQAAVLAHHAINGQADAAAWLEQVAADQSQPALRPAAVLAQTKGPTIELARFFHLALFGRQPLDPLENE